MKKESFKSIISILMAVAASRALGADAIQNVEQQPLNVTAIIMFLIFVVAT